MIWDDLDFWRSGEWQVIQERLDEFEASNTGINPKREDLFKALDLAPFDKVGVAIFGQDPYPNPSHATGLAFSVPRSVKELPPTLKNIFKELQADLHGEAPPNGDLTKWAKQGVLLWNVIPSCGSWASMSHEWTEWTYLTKEIVQKLSDPALEQPRVLVFMGAKAREYVQYANTDIADILETSHPSPRGALAGHRPFIGSRLFSTINSKLVGMGRTAVEWTL